MCMFTNIYCSVLTQNWKWLIFLISAGLQLSICSSIKYSFILYLCTRRRFEGSLRVNGFDYGKSTNGLKWLCIGHGGRRSPSLAGESCTYNDVKWREANSQFSLFNVLGSQTTRHRLTQSFRLRNWEQCNLKKKTKKKTQEWKGFKGVK